MTRKNRIVCLMPTFNRYPDYGDLVNEAVESFLRQDRDDALLYILNDTPAQRLVYEGRGNVAVKNRNTRYSTLCDKLQAMIDDYPDAEYYCRWDDDDISLPHRLGLSVGNLQLTQRDVQYEWHPDNHWYYNPPNPFSQTIRPGNVHNMAIFTKAALAKMGGYPKKLSGDEDQAFNTALRKAGISNNGTLLEPRQIFYIYRWGVSPNHLSGVGGDSKNLQRHYNRIGEKKIAPGLFEITPKWNLDYEAMAREAADALYTQEQDRQ